MLVYNQKGQTSQRNFHEETQEKEKNKSVKQSDFTARNERFLNKYFSDYETKAPEQFNQVRNTKQNVASTKQNTNKSTLEQYTAVGLQRKSKSKKNAFFAIYLLGAILAGLIYGIANEKLLMYLSEFVEKHFVFLNTSDFSATFLYCIWFSAFCLTVVFLCGLCVFGTPTLVIFFLLKGMGESVMLISCFATHQINGLKDYAISFGVISIVLALCLCAFAETSAKNSNRLFMISCSEKPLKASVTFKKLRGQYIFYLFLWVIISAGFAFVRVKFFV